LASFQKKEDTAIIRQILLSNNWKMGLTSFSLMQDYPNNSYMDVLKRYYPRNYYGILHWEEKIAEQLAYIETVASYKVAGSAEILKMILNRKPFMPYPADTSYLKEKLIYIIWNNPCQAYMELRKQIEPSIQKYEYERKIGRVNPLPIDTSDIPKDTSPEPVRW